MALKADILKVLGANSVVLFVNLINGFVLPYFLAIDDFALLKTFTLYIGFAGIFHFGFVDGINLKYGGVKDVEPPEIKGFHRFYIMFQLTITAVILVISILLKNNVLILFAITILPLNLHNFFLLFFQAIGEFRIYSKATIIPPIIVLFFTVLLLVLGVKSYVYYAAIIILSYVAAILFLEVAFKIKYHSSSGVFAFTKSVNIQKIFKTGIYILMGNVLFILLLNLGRWFVRIFLSNTEFAIFSLAVSMLSMVMLFTNSITLTFYPFLAQKGDLAVTQVLKKNFIAIGGAALLGFFPIKLILINFLPKYIDSIAITGVLLATIPGLFILQSLYVNVYKIRKKERNFFYDSLKYLLISIALHFAMFQIFENLLSISIATLISIYVWAFWPSKTTGELRFKVTEIMYLVLLIGFYLVIILNLSSVGLALIIYLLLYILLSLLFLKKTFVNLIRDSLASVSKLRGKF